MKNMINIHWAWGLIGVVIIVLSIFAPGAMNLPGYEPGSFDFAFIGAALNVVGGLAKGVVGLFGGKNKAKRKAAKEAKKEAKAAQKDAELAAKEAMYKGKTADYKAQEGQSKFMAIVSQYWWVGLIALGLVFVLPMITGKKKVGSNRGGARSRSGARGTAWSRKMLALRRRKGARRKK